MHNQDFTFKAEDGINLSARCWLPETTPKAVIILVHGIGEHSGRYEELAAFFTANNICIMAFDLRGHGKSEGKRGHTPSYSNWMKDLKIFIDICRKKFPDLPFILYGHSLGGNLAINYILRYKPELAGAIATSPELRLAFKPAFWKRWLAQFINFCWPSLTMPSGLEVDFISHDPQVIEAYKVDPLVHDRISARCYTGFMKAGEWAIKNSSNLCLPLLLLHGSEDHITSAPASEEFASKAGKLCVFRLWNGYYHELHNELEKAKVFNYILDWIKTIIYK
ncbi:MAG: lysophospholipase [Candidatus Margulisbacteria bacterium]|nr:lysophospholipase [Candidatus Margulisiibacteriota bacterium]